MRPGWLRFFRKCVSFADCWWLFVAPQARMSALACYSWRSSQSFEALASTPLLPALILDTFFVKTCQFANFGARSSAFFAKTRLFACFCVHFATFFAETRPFCAFGTHLSAFFSQNASVLLFRCSFGHVFAQSVSICCW